MPLLKYINKKFEINWAKIKGGSQTERKTAEMISYSKMPLVMKIESVSIDFRILQKIVALSNNR